MISKRTELKYILTLQEAIKIRAGLEKLFAGSRKKQNYYTVRSLYFDDIYNNFLLDNINGINPREKYRVRIYNMDTNKIFLECKTKNNSISYKERCLLTNNELNNIMTGSLNCNDKRKVYKKFYIKSAFCCLLPKVIIEYNRYALESPSGDVRITFDNNIQSSRNIYDFLNPLLNLNTVLTGNFCIMEIKYSYFFPDYLDNIINTKNLKRIAYSKYQYSRKI